MHTHEIITIAGFTLIAFGALIGYIIRIERTLTGLLVDVRWIKRTLELCPPTSEKSSP
ncbi:hypothetical protein ES703_102988 [subsurface metagenome]